jgi:hypothetical protein
VEWVVLEPKIENKKYGDRKVSELEVKVILILCLDWLGIGLNLRLTWNLNF